LCYNIYRNSKNSKEEVATMKRVVLLVSFFLLTALSFNQESEQKKAQEIKGLIKIERGGSDPQYKDWDRFTAIIPSQSLMSATKEPAKQRSKSSTFTAHKGRSSKSAPRRPQTSSYRHQEVKTGSQPASVSAQSLQSKSSTSVRGAESRATTSADTKANASKEEKTMIGVDTIAIVGLVLGIIALALILGFPFSMYRQSGPVSTTQTTRSQSESADIPPWQSMEVMQTIRENIDLSGSDYVGGGKASFVLTRHGVLGQRTRNSSFPPSISQPPPSTSQAPYSHRPRNSGGKPPSRQNQRPAGESSAETPSQSQEG
jgi:hypothetical protein